MRFELLHSVPLKQKKSLEEFLATFPILETPQDLWEDAILLGQKCREMGFNPRPLDILIAQVCRAHKIGLATFD